MRAALSGLREGAPASALCPGRDRIGSLGSGEGTAATVGGGTAPPLVSSLRTAQRAQRSTCCRRAHVPCLGFSSAGCFEPLGCAKAARAAWRVRRADTASRSRALSLSAHAPRLADRLYW